MKARIQFDGGCSPNPGQKYGSFAIALDDVFEIRRLRFPLGYGTNNEAEFEALLSALNDLQKSCWKAQVPTNTVDVEMFTDSTIVRNWLQKFASFKPHKCKDERRLAMSALAGRCLEILSAFKAFTIEWNSREINVEAFGH